MRRTNKGLAVIFSLLFFPGCHSQPQQSNPLSTVVLRTRQSGPTEVDRKISIPSKFPVAADPVKVGVYEADTKSGAGYFYDDVLEYRVWLHPECGAARVRDGNDYYAAFAQFERAEEFSKKTKGAEIPLVLIRQREWIDEPSPRKYEPKSGERITEWRIEWLKDSHREADTIAKFLKHPREIREAPPDEPDCRQ